MLTQTRNVWVIARPAEDVPGQWVGHCLDFDIVSLGTSLRHALAMTAEAVCMCLEEDVKSGAEPFSRSPAPAQYWEERDRVVREGTYGPAPENQDVVLVTQFRIELHEEHSDDDDACVEQLPPAWMIGAMGQSAEVRA
jgi:hypothetical protein